ncbi:FkbM family methyltransferase [bacterium]|nr:FkbM family methyltransferase [bacterium]
MSKDPIVFKKVGKRALKMRESHKLPEYYESFELYDRALPRIAKKLRDIDGHVTVIDIGANIGDTASLITEELVANILCVEGDKDYLPFLKENVLQLSESKIIIEESYCAETDGMENSVEVDRSDGTAKLLKKKENALEREGVNLKKLDSILAQQPTFKNANLLKIDTDGFETEVLRGATTFLHECSALVFFEFTPSAYIANKNNPLEVFRILASHGYKNALFYDNFGKPRIIITITDEKRILELIEKIDRNTIYYYDVLAWKEGNDSKYREVIDSELFSIMYHYEEISKSAESIIPPQVVLTQSHLNIDTRNEELDNLRHSYDSALQELEFVNNSNGWKLLQLFRRISARFFPLGSYRRFLLMKFLVGIKRVVQIIIRGSRKIDELVWRIKNKISKIFRDRKKVLNGNKLIYVDHSFHSRTKSNNFLSEYLKEYFDVDVVLDYSWKGLPHPDLSFIDESYGAVIFFQTIPPSEIVNGIKNEHKIYVPMYDGLTNKEASFWRQYKDIRVLCFSKITYDLFSSFGMKALYIQYFPEPKPYNPGDDSKLFFWQRLTSINIQTVITLLGKKIAQIHIHRVVDPGHTFIEPSETEIKKYNITFSEWLSARAMMWEIAEQAGIYVAPREMEGIGLSFLEAMARGKVVIATDNPTMNEYIVHKETGFLFNLEDVQPIELQNLKKIHEQTYEYMLKGYGAWMKDRQRIIEFIKKSYREDV